MVGPLHIHTKKWQSCNLNPDPWLKFNGILPSKLPSLLLLLWSGPAIPGPSHWLSIWPHSRSSPFFLFLPSQPYWWCLSLQSPAPLPGHVQGMVSQEETPGSVRWPGYLTLLGGESAWGWGMRFTRIKDVTASFLCLLDSPAHSCPCELAGVVEEWPLEQAWQPLPRKIQAWIMQARSSASGRRERLLWGPL